MATRKRSTRYNPKTYKVYGQTPSGNYTLQLAMTNDYGLYHYVRRNNKKLAKMPKDIAIRTIKSHATENWAIKDLRDVNGRNVKSANLKWYLRNFND